MSDVILWKEENLKIAIDLLGGKILIALEEIVTPIKIRQNTNIRTSEQIILSMSGKLYLDTNMQFLCPKSDHEWVAQPLHNLRLFVK